MNYFLKSNVSHLYLLKIIYLNYLIVCFCSSIYGARMEFRALYMLETVLPVSYRQIPYIRFKGKKFKNKPRKQ